MKVGINIFHCMVSFDQHFSFNLNLCVHQVCKNGCRSTLKSWNFNFGSIFSRSFNSKDSAQLLPKYSYVVDIYRMTKNQNQDFQGREAGQGYRAKREVGGVGGGGGVRGIMLISETFCITLIHISMNFHKDFVVKSSSFLCPILIMLFTRRVSKTIP